MSYEELKKILMNYGWRNGVTVPQLILKHQKCDLALAMEIFYISDGYGFFLNSNSGSSDWLQFISGLFGDIVAGKYPSTGNHYRNPLTDAQKNKMRENGIPEIFLSDI